MRKIEDHARSLGRLPSALQPLQLFAVLVYDHQDFGLPLGEHPLMLPLPQPWLRPPRPLLLSPDA